MTVPRFVLLSIPLIFFSIGIGDSFAQDAGENAVVAEGRYALTGAFKAGHHATWRVDRTDGRVSLCARLEKGIIACSDWSNPARNGSGPYEINADFSQVIDRSWVWRVDTQSGEIAMCSLRVPASDISDKKPTCQTLHGQE
jgi:hypothetical protein